MVKEGNGFELSKNIRHKYSVRVKFHPSAKASCINDHIKPVIRSQEADHIILHTGANDAMVLSILLCQLKAKLKK